MRYFLILKKNLAVKITVLLFFLIAHLAMGNSNSWSKTGHRVGDVAQGL